MPPGRIRKLDSQLRDPPIKRFRCQRQLAANMRRSKNHSLLCRFHHQLKQHPRWRLDQPAPGTFTWTTPTGRTYRIEPDQQAA
jgi:hypothetical protein